MNIHTPLRHSLKPENQEQLLQFRTPSETRPAGDHLRKNTAGRPHIDGGSVITCTQQNLWRAVPQGNHLTCQVHMVTVQRETACEPKVSKFQSLVVADQNVRRLEVPVHHAGAVTVCQRGCELLQEYLRAYSVLRRGECQVVDWRNSLPQF